MTQPEGNFSNIARGVQGVHCAVAFGFLALQTRPVSIGENPIALKFLLSTYSAGAVVCVQDRSRIFPNLHQRDR